MDQNATKTRLYKCKKGDVFDYSFNRNIFITRIFLYEKPGILLWDLENDKAYRFLMNKYGLDNLGEAYSIPALIIRIIDMWYINEVSKNNKDVNIEEIVDRFRYEAGRYWMYEVEEEEFRKVIYGED